MDQAGSGRLRSVAARLLPGKDPTVTVSPDIRYARADDGVHIAYQVLGEGPTDLLFVTLFSNLVHVWQEPRWAAFHERLSSFARLILFDKRGTGLSDRPNQLPTLEARIDDVRVVLDAVGSERATLFGSMEGGQITALFAATDPQRTDRLVLYNTVARHVRSDEHPWGPTPEAWRTWVAEVGERWGDAAFMQRLLRSIDQELARDPSFVAWYTDEARLAASPAAVAEIYRIMGETDITDVLPAIPRSHLAPAPRRSSRHDGVPGLPDPRRRGRRAPRERLPDVGR